MSRFFHTGDSSDSESTYDSDDDNDLAPSSNSAARSHALAAAKTKNAMQTDRFQYESSSDSEEGGRVIRSEKDKRYDDMKDTCKTLRNYVKIQDWVNSNKQMDILQKKLAKASNITSLEGIPKFYLQAMLHTDDATKNVTKQAAKKLSQNNFKNLNSVKAKLKKWHKEYEQHVEAYLANPLASEEEKEEEDDDQSDGGLIRRADESDSEEQSEEEVFDDSNEDEFDDESELSESDEVWDDTDVDDSDIDLNEIKAATTEGKGPMYQRSYWTKKPEDAKKLQMKEQQRKRDEQMKRERREKAKVEKVSEEGDKKRTNKKSTQAQDFTPEAIIKKLRELLSQIGKRSTDRKLMIEELEILNQHATDQACLLKIRTTLIAAYFEINMNMGTHMSIESWKKCTVLMSNIVDQISSSKTVRLIEDEQVDESFDSTEDDEDVIKAMDTIITGTDKKDDDNNESKEVKQDVGPKIQYVAGNMYGFIHRLCMEFTRSLRNIDHHSPEYIKRLLDEASLISLVSKTRIYYQSIKKVTFETQVVLELLELKYYRYSAEWDVLSSDNNTPIAKTANGLVPSRNEIVDYAMFLYENGDVRARTRALLLHAFHLALHNRFDETRDLILMSHVEDNINDADVKTRIFFNRTMAQLGLCAFRCGKFFHALNCLQDLFQTMRVKELLGQGQTTSRYYERDPEQEKLEKQRQFPFHLHFNQDLLESCYLIGAMFSEIPNLVETGSFQSKRIISRQFRRLYDNLVRQAFTAPPENSRDFIMFATRAIVNGKWKQGFEYLSKLRMWNFMSNKKIVQETMLIKLKSTSLKCFLSVHGSNYVSITSELLEQRFALPAKDVRRIVSSMIFERRLEAAWDQPSGCLMLYRNKMNKLEKAALMYADKAVVLTDQNDRLLAPRHNLFHNFKGRGGRYGGRHYKGGRNHQRGGNRNTARVNK